MKLNSSPIAATVALLLVAAFSQTTQARKIEGFEAGDPAFTSTGDAGTRGTYETGAPSEGTTQYLITTIASSDGDGLSSQSGANAVSNATLQTFFNGISLAGGFQGSGILIPFTIAAGETTLTLQYDFLSNEPFQNIRNDFAFTVIFDSTNAVAQAVNRFATVAGSTFSFFGPQNPFIDHTGIQTLVLSLSGLVPGNYSLGIGVDDAGATDGASGLLIDNIQVIPEPSTLALATIGAALLLVGFRSRTKRA